MSGYHITPNSTKAPSRRLPCVAGPGNCKYVDAPHFETKAAADQFLAFREELEAAARKARLDKLHSDNASIEQALRSDLNYQGPKPAWWGEFRETAMNHPELAHEPELLDVIDSPVGPLAVVWEDRVLSTKGNLDWASQVKDGWGLKRLELRSVETGENFGYVKVNYRNPESFARSFGTDELAPFRYQDADMPGYYHDDDDMAADLSTLTPEEREALDRRLWVSSWHGMNDAYFQRPNGSYVSNREVRESDAPADHAAVKKDLAGFAKKIQRHVNELHQTSANPLVDYSKVGNDDTDLQGLGLGTAIYVYTARKLATQGTALLASGVQTPEAQATWARFAKRFPEQVVPFEYKYNGKPKSGKLLDFRETR
jgi:hypothetical protein